MIHADREPDLQAVLDRTLSAVGPARVVRGDRMRRWLHIVHAMISPLHERGMLGYFALDIGVAEDEFEKVLEHERTWFVAHQLIGRPQPMQTLRAIQESQRVLHKAGAVQLAESALPALVDAEAARHLLRRTTSSRPTTGPRSRRR